MSAQKPLRRSLLILGIALILVLLTTLVTGTVAARQTPRPRTWQAVVGTQSQDQAIQGMMLLPNALWVNVGDTVVWTAKGADIHTVTFLKPGQIRPPFNPNDPLQALPQGGHVYDGVSYDNSGLMSSMPGLPGGQSYTLTFGVAGDFTYDCLVHFSMLAVIHVRPAGTSYPYSQADYNQQIEQNTASMLREEQKLATQADEESSNQQVTVGIGDGMVTIMRVFPQRIVIHVGQSVIFTNRDIMEPHTVTFGPTSKQGNPKAFDGSTPLNSGYIGIDPHWFGMSYAATFVKAGTYAFRCDLHDMMGMVITIVVLPR